nr:hypothetical protein [Pontibacter russatus]
MVLAQAFEHLRHHLLHLRQEDRVHLVLLQQVFIQLVHLARIAVQAAAFGVALVVVDALLLHLVARERLLAAAAPDVVAQWQLFVLLHLGVAVGVLRLQPVHPQECIPGHQRLVPAFYYLALLQQAVGDEAAVKRVAEDLGQRLVVEREALRL